jgi:hypothetical protein
MPKGNEDKSSDNHPHFYMTEPCPCRRISVFGKLISTDRPLAREIAHGENSDQDLC